MSFGAPGPGLQVRVLLVLSQPVVASALRERIAIEPNLTVVAETTDELSVPTLLDHHAVDVVVIDGRLPGGGLALVSAVRARATASVIVLADACDGPTVVEAVCRGAEGYVLKTEPVSVIVGAVSDVARGDRWLSGAARDALVDELQAGGVPTLPHLSPRELQILDLFANGLSSSSIGTRLHLSESTVKHHRTNIYSKLGVTSAAAAVYQAMRRGVLE